MPSTADPTYRTTRAYEYDGIGNRKKPIQRHVPSPAKT